MQKTIHILRESGRLVPFVNKIQEETEKAFKLIQEKISIPDVDVVFHDNPSAVIPELGIVGHAITRNTIFIALDPGHKNFDTTISKEILRTLAHELHHVTRWENPGYGDTLFEAMISEGLADHFDIEVTNEKLEPWDTALKKKDIEIFLEKAKKEFKNKNYSHYDWFFGSKKRGIPRWTGYSLGFYIVDQYLKKFPNEKASNLYSAKAGLFLA